MAGKLPTGLSLAALALSPLLGGGDPPAAPVFRSEAHLLYLPLESREGERLVERALELGRLWLEKPAIEVKRVQLRRSVPREEGAPLRRDFQLTEITDSREGVFTIYLSALPGTPAFEGQLAHEAFHLWNARLRDVYVEGLNCLLAEDLLRALGLPWEPWLEHFRSGKEPLYAEAYFLLHGLAAEIGREPLYRLLRFAVDSASDPRHQEIDIDRWLKSLDAGLRTKAEATITRRFDVVEAARKVGQPELSFRRPCGGAG